MESTCRKLLTRAGVFGLLALALLLLVVTSTGTFGRNQLLGHDCVVNAASHISYGGCVKQYAIPLLLSLCLSVYVLRRLWKLLWKQRERLQVGWPVLIFLAAATMGVYINGCVALNRQQAEMDGMMDEYYKGDRNGWVGSKSYRRAFSSFLRWQQLELSPYSGSLEHISNLTSRIRSHLVEYERMLNETIPMSQLDGAIEQSPTLLQLVNQSYLEKEEYELIHQNISQKADVKLTEFEAVAANGSIFDLKRLQNHISYRKRLETKFSGWMEDRFMLLNIAQTLYVYGGWIVFWLLMGCFAVIALQNWLQPRRCAGITHRLPVLCSLGLPFIIFLSGFFLSYLVGSTLAEIHDYDSGIKQLGGRQSLLVEHKTLNKTVNMCFLTNNATYEKAQVGDVMHSLLIHPLKQNLDRMSIDIGGLGEQSQQPYNIFRMVEQFNLKYSQNICQGIVIVVKEYSVTGPEFRHINRYKSLPNDCSKQVKPLAEFIQHFNVSCKRLKQQLEDAADLVHQLEERVLTDRFLPFLKSKLYCNVLEYQQQSIDSYVRRTLEQQSQLVDRLSYLSSGGLILAFIVFGILAIRNKHVRFAQLDSDSSEPYSPIANPR